MTAITKTLHGIEVEFYQQEHGKYTCRVKNDPKSTRLLLDSCKTKAVRADRLHFFIKGIAEKIESGVLSGQKQAPIPAPPIGNPIIVLSELVQKHFVRSLEARVIAKNGQDHCPTITVSIVLPDGTEERASGCNQREAKQKAARRLLESVFGITAKE